MKVIIFDDRDNFSHCLGAINKQRPEGERRFWKLPKYHDFFFKKLKEVCNWQSEDTKLIRSYVYTGKYTSNVMNKLKRQCGKKIGEMNELITREEILLQELSKHTIPVDLKRKIETHVNALKSFFHEIKEYQIQQIEKNQKYSLGQKKFFLKFPLRSPARIDLKTTPLKNRGDKVIQKGVDVLLATDLINLAHNNAYDVALIFGGDADLTECIKLVREILGKIVVIVAYHDEQNPLASLISKDLITEADYFINVKELREEEICSFSELRVIKENEKV